MEQQAISSDLIRGHIDTIILHTLLSGDKFAQQISDAVEEKSDKEYKLNQATLYSSLKRLESLKYVNSYWNDADAGGRRKFFELTELGRKTVENSLTNWSYSRAIIDKLMDCTPQPVYQTQYVEKIVEVPVEKTVYIEKQVPVQTVIKEEQQQLRNIELKDAQKEENGIEQPQEKVQEINFRNILNGLIKATSTQSIQEDAPVSVVEKEPETVLKETEVLKFNQTIYETDYNDHRSNNGKIDFGDLSLKAAKEGYKIRISSKDSYATSGTLLINKLNLGASLGVFLLVMFELLMYSLVHANTLELTLTSSLITIAILAIFPIFNIVRYMKNPNKYLQNSISADSILTSAIIVFNLFLITLAGALLFDLDFSNSYQVLLYIAVPITLYFDIPIYYIIRYYLSKTKIYNTSKRKKTA